MSQPPNITLLVQYFVSCVRRKPSPSRQSSDILYIHTICGFVWHPRSREAYQQTLRAIWGRTRCVLLNDDGWRAIVQLCSRAAIALFFVMMVFLSHFCVSQQLLMNSKIRCDKKSMRAACARVECKKPYIYIMPWETDAFLDKLFLFGRGALIDEREPRKWLRFTYIAICGI